MSWNMISNNNGTVSVVTDAGRKYNITIPVVDGSYGTQDQIKEFEYFVGNLLTQMLDDGVKNNDLIYSGGVDEN